MKTFLIKIGLFFAILLFYYQSDAQNGKATEMTLSSCLKMAIGNNPKLKSVVLESRKTRYKIKEVRSTGFPQLNISGTFDDYLKLPTSLIPGEIFGKPGELIPVQFGTKYNTSGNLDASQLIFSKTFFTGLKSVNELISYNELNIEKVKEELIYQVAQLYFSSQIISIQKKNLENALIKLDSLEIMADLQYKNGLIKKIDVDRIVVARVNLQTEINNVDLLFRQQLSLLKYQIGMENQLELSLAVSSETDELAVNIESKAENHVDIRLLEKQKSLAMLDLEANKAAYYPTLSAYGRYSYQNMQNELKFGKGSSDWLNTSMIGLSLNIPVFDGFLKNSKIQQAKIQVEQVSMAVDDSKNYLNTTIRNAAEGYSNSKLNFDIQERNILLAENIWKVTYDLYQKGLAPLTDLLNAETTLKESLNNKAQAHIRMQLAALDLLKANGQLLTILNK